jgi:hypothetical protein
MRLPSTVFETVASTIPPLRHGRTSQVYLTQGKPVTGLALSSFGLGHLCEQLTEARDGLIYT